MTQSVQFTGMNLVEVSDFLEGNEFEFRGSMFVIHPHSSKIVVNKGDTILKLGDGSFVVEPAPNKTRKKK